MYDYCRILKKRKRKKRLAVLVSALLAVAVIAVCHYAFYMVPLIRRIAEEQARILATTSVGRAAAETVTDAYSYGDLIEVSKDADGNIVLLQANSTLIHVLVRTTASRAQSNLGAAEELNIRVPMGTLTGFTFLSGRGPDVTVKAIPVGVISTQVESEFIAAGINQTLHKIFLRVRADITLILPGFESRVSSTTHIPITESLLVGKVPDFYFTSAFFDKTLNLVP